MLNLITGAYAPQFELLQTINEKPPAIVKVVEPTLEEKIKTNFYKCNTDLQWIRKDNAECLAKPVATVQTVNKTTKAQKPVKQAVQGSQGLNGYEPGQCVWYVKNLKPEIPNTWGSAVSWYANAQADGWATGTEPRVGAVGWSGGHVVLITAVNPDGTVSYTDMNGRWVAYEIGYGTKPASYYKYIY